MNYRALLALIISLAFSGCGASAGGASQALGSHTLITTGACAGIPQMGEWSGMNGRLYLNGDCSGYDEACNATFTWTVFNQAIGNNAQAVATSSIGGATCMSVGTNAIGAHLNGTNTAMTISLGVNSFGFTRIQ